MTTTTHTAVLTTPTPTSLQLERAFAAPAAAVYRAWTEPALVRRWWAGERGIVTAADIDLRVGGAWRFVMEAEGGVEVAFHGEYRALDPGRILAFSEVFEGMADAACETTVRFAERDGVTVATMVCEHASPGHRDAHLHSGMEAGAQESLAALERVAAELQAAGAPPS